MEIMQFKNVYKNYEDKGEIVHALKETSFTLYAGELVAIIGPSGSGKSTLLTMMGGLQRPSGGEIYFMNERLDTMEEKKRNILRFNKIGFVLQTSNLVPYLTLQEQFELVDRFSNRRFNATESEELMKKLDIYKRKNQYPNDLSGGEKQRAAICRALYTKPGLLLADEPTASLDSEKAMEVIKLLKDLTMSANRTTVLITHDNRLLKYCDRVFKIIDGVMVEEK